MNTYESLFTKSILYIHTHTCIYTRIVLLYFTRAHTRRMRNVQNSNALDVDSDASCSVGDSGSSAFKLNVKLIARESTNRLTDKLRGMWAVCRVYAVCR